MDGCAARAACFVVCPAGGAIQRHPVAERLARQALYVPAGLTITEAQIETVCVALREALATE